MLRTDWPYECVVYTTVNQDNGYFSYSSEKEHRVTHGQLTPYQFMICYTNPMDD